MGITVTHTKVSAKSDGADSALVQPSDWNATHTVNVTDFPQYISANTTKTVKASGGDYTTIGAALQFLRDKMVSDAAVVTISIDPGTYAEQISIESRYAKQLYLEGSGENISITGVASSSGSAGSYTYVLDVSSVGNAVAGNYLIIKTTTGGTQGDAITGLLKIVSVGTNQITAVSQTRQATYQASGLVTATARLVRTVVSNSGPVLSITNTAMGRSLSTSARAFNDIVFECVDTGTAVYVGPGAILVTDATNVGFINTSTGQALDVDGGRVHLPNGNFSGGAITIRNDNQSVVVANSSLIIGGSTYGVQTVNGSLTNLTSAKISVSSLYAARLGWNELIGMTSQNGVALTYSPAVNTLAIATNDAGTNNA